MGVTPDTRLRAACDRCHAQKSRCPRRTGQDTCERCSKAGAICRFSPFRERKEDSEVAADGEKNGGRLKRKRMDHHTPTTTRQPELEANEGRSLMISDVTGEFIWPMGQTVVPTEQQTGYDWSFSDAGADPSAFDLDFPLASGSDTLDMTPYSVTEIEEASEASGPLLAPIFPTENSNVRLGTAAPSDCIKELSTLSMDLFEHQETVPSTHEVDFEKWGQKAANYKLEDTLSLTQRLINVYSSFMSAFTGDSHSEERAGTDIVSTPEPDRGRPTILESVGEASTIAITSQFTSYARTATRKSLDSASVFLLISSHLRLNSIYTTLFTNMQQCISRCNTPCPKALQQARFTVPPLTIGSYAPPREQTISMHFYMLSGMMSSLERWSGILADAIKGMVGNVTGGTSEADMVSQTAENMRVQAQRMSERLTGARNEVLSLGIPT